MREQKTPQVSAVQKDYFATERLAAPGPWMNVALAWRIRGILNLKAMEAAVSHVVQRHGILRTRFHLRGGTLEPEIGAIPSDVLHIEDIPPSTSSTAFAAALDAEVRRPFVLHRDMPFRARLLRLGDATSVLILTAHHMVVDAHSFDVIFNELVEYYNSVEEGRPHRLPEPAPQYFEYIAESKVDGTAMMDDVHFWSCVLQDAPTAIALPFDYPRPKKQVEPTVTAVSDLPLDLSKAVFTLARKQSVSAFAVCLTALRCLLERLSHQSDFVIVIASGTRTPRAANIVGPLVHPVFFRCTPPEDPDTVSFCELTKRMFWQTLEGLLHSKVTFGQLMNLIPALRLQYQFHSVQIAVTYLSSRLRSIVRFGSLEAEPLVTSAQAGLAAQDLSFIIVEKSTATQLQDNPKHLRIAIRYRPDLFKDSTIDRILCQFGGLLGELLKYPDQPLKSFDQRDLDGVP